MAFPKWVIGVLCTVVGSVVLNFGANVQRYSHLKNAAKPREKQHWVCLQPIWLLGFGLFLAGNIADFVALGFAAQTIIAPLGSVSLLSNCIFAPLFLKEKFVLRDFISTMVIIGGTILIVIFGSKQDSAYNLDQLLQLFRTPDTIGFLVGTVALTILTLSFLGFLERAPLAADGRLKRAAPKLLPFGYPFAGGLIGSITVLFAKATSELVRVTLFENDNQLVYGLSYAIIGAFLFCAISQLFFLNRSLARYDATYIIPVYYGTWVAFSITGGQLYYQEFEGFTVAQWIMYFLGVALVLLGVVLLSRRIVRGDIDTARCIQCAQERDAIAAATEELARSSTDGSGGVAPLEGVDAVTVVRTAGEEPAAINESATATDAVIGGAWDETTVEMLEGQQQDGMVVRFSRGVQATGTAIPTQWSMSDDGYTSADNALGAGQGDGYTRADNIVGTGGTGTGGYDVDGRRKSLGSCAAVWM
eukprot:TRINITY_DN12931_c0_g1_i1.p1 TRINITY_DN12931_c0_g1~~TRINITY_DN12931_c0_g1_i1.p1  ORF type:complete len:474 (-),score=99.18 TRINITY_DN12931_c0_g1_i1:235-1656(-)